MAQADTTPDAAPEMELEGGTYEIIRNRLANFGDDLRQRLTQLNGARKDVFGAIDTKLLGTERITTDNNCVPRDMFAVGSKFVFGYNVHIGLKSEISLEDVFAVYEFRDHTFHQQPLKLLGDERFNRDFHEVYKYYKNATFAKFFLQGPFVYMVFRVGRATSDIKALKWRFNGDQLVYVDNRSDHEVRFPPQHEFEWQRTHRELHQHGVHPHISIEDRVFVETVGGDLTIKVEDNTDSGEGIYAEDVDHKDQTLDDAEIYYAVVGNLILLKIRPYQEDTFRYIVFNEKTQHARRVDSVEQACVLLPDDHGLIFSNGYYLQTGEFKTFDSDVTNMLFERRVAASNGEDYLYFFYNRQSGVSTLLEYNLIEQRVRTPLVVNGSTMFEGGELVCFKAHDDPQKHHAVQIWQTPYVGEDVSHTEHTDSFLYKIGNKDLVRGMAECHEVLNLIDKEDAYAGLYIDLAKKSGDVADSYFWASSEDCFDLKDPLTKIKGAADAAIEEFDKVVRVRQNTADETKRVRASADEISAALHRKRFDHINDFVSSLGDLRKVRGEIITLRELRYVDLELVDKLEETVAEDADKLAGRCVEFLLREDSLQPYVDKVEAEKAGIDELTKVTDAKALSESIDGSSAELEMLIDIVSNLKIDDATHRTSIIDNISVIFSSVNQARAALKNKTRELASVEGIAEFGSQLKLLNQSVVNYLDVCDTPERCEEFLTKVMVQLEELEGRFAEFDEFVEQLTEKREEVYNAFESRKLALVEKRNKRANALMSAANRILNGVKSRVESFDSINDINGYFAADLMIEKVRDIVKQLDELDDSVKVDDIQSRLKSIREDAVRQLKDRQDLFVGGENIIKFGDQHFTVNVQDLDLTLVRRDGEMCLHLTGTNFFEPLDHVELNDCRDVWDQEVISENREVYRGEFLAYQLFRQLTSSDGEVSTDDLLRMDEKERHAFVQSFMGPRYNESYVKGVSDHDAIAMLKPLLEMHSGIGKLRYHAISRALAAVFWNLWDDAENKVSLLARIQGFASVARVFPGTDESAKYIAVLREAISQFVTGTTTFDKLYVEDAARYLFEELQTGESFVVSRNAANLFESFHGQLRSSGSEGAFQDSAAAVKGDPHSRYVLMQDWAKSFVNQEVTDSNEQDFVDELARLLDVGEVDPTLIVEGDVATEIKGLVGSHSVIESGEYYLHYNHFHRKLTDYIETDAPRFQRYVELKHEVVEQSREEMRLEEFKPRVLTSFVRNKLIDSVYLPLIGDNLAKQMGAAGEQKRTDRMGLLLLISPPGYGKTTLMEYIANRLGIVFMKINGPAIGHQVTSLDPNEAPNAGAREEIEKLNLSLEMGDNVMIYLDDIQHCNPEFLQKFISLCDAQRKIEGVYKGRTRTYDFRGRKVAVVMAGNPYTESGEKFQIPDMLSNRADIYNLGEIIGDSAGPFELSYLENSLTSNPILNKLATRSQADVYSIIQMAERDTREGIELEGSYSLEELNEFVAVMKKLLRIRDVVLRVNQEYIRSAAQADEYRVEPPFLLQGSYRNMNRMAEKVVPIMNDEELESLILSSYENDAQTLTSNTESNLLKLRGMLDILTPEEQQRWDDICRAFKQNVKMKGVGSDDKFGQVLVQMGSFTDGLESIRRAMADGIKELTQEDEIDDSQPEPVALLVGQFEQLRASLDNIHQSVSEGPIEAIEQLAQTLRENAPAITAAAEQQEDPQPSERDPIEQAHDGTTPMHRITVQHKVPRSILEVVRSQFELMHNWLKPIMGAVHDQRSDIAQLRQSVEDCMTQYADLLGDLEDAKKPPRKPPKAKPAKKPGTKRK